VHHYGIRNRIPAEVILKILASLAGARILNSAPDVALSDVHWHGAVKEDVDTPPTLSAARNLGDVRIVSCPHSAVLPDDSHDQFSGR
jgi:hypothetical protein